jgi:hypothetical protein
LSYISSKQPTGIIPFVPFLGTEGLGALPTWVPSGAIFVAGAVAAYFAFKLFSKSKARRRRKRPVKMLSPRPLSRSKYDVVVGKTLSHHSSEQGAAREARRFTRRGIRATIKKVG